MICTHPNYSQIIDTEVICTSEVMHGLTCWELFAPGSCSTATPQAALPAASLRTSTQSTCRYSCYSMRSTFIELCIYRALQFRLNVAYIRQLDYTYRPICKTTARLKLRWEFGKHVCVSHHLASVKYAQNCGSYIPAWHIRPGSIMSRLHS